MKPDGQTFEIVAREDYSDATFMLEIRHPLMARAARPGQFVIVMSHPEGERIPLTLADFDPRKGTITLVIQAVGKTTREMQQSCQVGTRLHALVGPMGVPSVIGKAKKVACVGGGLGVAPMYPQARAYKQAGAYVIGIVGWRSCAQIFWEDKFRSVCDELILCTNDGSKGIRGIVTDGLRICLEKNPDLGEVIAIGPPIMMKACAEATRARKVKTMVSVNPVMVDGTGMCGGCRVTVGREQKFVCVDGPEFDGHQVDFAELMARVSAYREQEAVAMQRYRAPRALTPAR